MKKMVIFMSVLILLLSVLSACDKKENNTDSNPTVTSDTTRGEKYETTAPIYTVGDVQTSEKVKISDNEYNIAYYDTNGAGAKVEFYRNGKLVYYYISSSVDKDGNCIQQKYYTANGKFIGAFDNGYFFDEKGQQISEDVFATKLNK